jgi:hypothetical protein
MNRNWLAATPVTREVDSKKVDQELPAMEEMLSQFKQVRESEMEMLSKFEDADWKSIRSTTFWGDVSLYWLVCKTYQHTNEHTHDVLRLGLFWDRIMARMAQS